MKSILVLSGLLSMSVMKSANAVEPTPPGIGVRMTMAGPVFVDQHGMTLYQRTGPVAGLGLVACPDRPETVIPVANVVDSVVEFPMLAPDAASRRSCTDKYPPLVASPDAKPIGRWSVGVRENGVHQWAYAGQPLHVALKDKRPGEFNARNIVMHENDIGSLGWQTVAAPLEAPAGVETRLTSLGLALTTHEGKPLYFPAANDATVPDESWKPASVALATLADHLPTGWSIVNRRDGTRQWAWNQRLLYTYIPDTGDRTPGDQYAHAFVDVFGANYGEPIAGWRVAVLQAASAPPPGVRVMSVGSGPEFRNSAKIYADARGKTLYALFCSESTADRLDCDDRGDSPRYWQSFCGGTERCQKTWQPLLAQLGTRPIDGLWAVALMNPHHPYQRLEPGEQALSVWTYQGHFVFTYSADEHPGDTWGVIYDQNVQTDSIAAFAAPRS